MFKVVIDGVLYDSDNTPILILMDEKHRLNISMMEPARDDAGYPEPTAIRKYVVYEKNSHDQEDIRLLMKSFDGSEPHGSVGKIVLEDD